MGRLLPGVRPEDRRGGQVVTCGLVFELRTYDQITGTRLEFMTLADGPRRDCRTRTLCDRVLPLPFCDDRYPVLEMTAKVEPFENGLDFTLRVLRAGNPGTKQAELVRMPE